MSASGGTGAAWGAGPFGAKEFGSAYFAQGPDFALVVIREGPARGRRLDVCATLARPWPILRLFLAVPVYCGVTPTLWNRSPHCLTCPRTCWSSAFGFA
jgi:hypothetical protein